MQTSPDEYSPDQVRNFLDAYAATGSVTRAAKAAGIRPATHYARLASDPGYRQAFQTAQQQLVWLLEEKAFRRALAGSDELIMFLLRAWMPERYGDRTIHEHVSQADAREAICHLSKEKLQ
jgi:hypothetical protein